MSKRRERQARTSLGSTAGPGQEVAAKGLDPVGPLNGPGPAYDGLMNRLDRIVPVTPTPVPTLRLDFGCGPNPRDGFEGVDAQPFDGKVKHVLDLVACPGGSYARWPWPDGSVVEGHSSHFVEHLTSLDRCHFWNELHRVLVLGGKCTIVVPHWASCRAYGDPTHKWPPMSEFAWYYLSREWRLGNPAKRCPGLDQPVSHGDKCAACGGRGVIVIPANAPHTDARHGGPLNCDFEVTWGYSPHPLTALKNQEAQQFAFQFYKEAIQDMVATLVKK